ncbi:MAG: hypothetical protein A2Y41_09995 [Spirochaetes bacterium GWB1_36_13]|nr:MAG: hypothetical protein A2Y41_09995 [Spirochaetes bacterium GWB1_36_13]
MQKAIFHLHTHCSKDASIQPEALLDFALKHDIKILGVTDHNSIQGALEVQELALRKSSAVKVIVGSEIATESGEVIGLFLKKDIQSRMSVLKTIEEIKSQNGLVYLPHPFDTLRRERIRDKSLIEQNEKWIDVIEVFNSRCLKRKDNRNAAIFSDRFQKHQLWGSDAHFLYELKNCIVEMPGFENQNDFLEKLKYAKPIATKKSYRGFLQSILRKYLFF